MNRGRSRLPWLVPLVALAAGAAHAGEVELTVHGTRADTLLHWALYANAEQHEAGRSQAGGRVEAGDGETVVVIPELASGRYSVAVFLDTDRDGEFDQGFLGIPREPFGFSNDAIGRFSAPDFEAAAFSVGDDTTRISLTLRRL